MKVSIATNPIAASIRLVQARISYNTDTSREASDFKLWFPAFSKAALDAGFWFDTFVDDPTIVLDVWAPLAQQEQLGALVESHMDEMAPLLPVFARRTREGSGYGAAGIDFNVARTGMSGIFPHKAVLFGKYFDRDRFDAEARAPYWFALDHLRVEAVLCRDERDAVLAKLMDTL